MMFLILTGIIWTLAIVFGFIMVSARYRKTYIIRRGKWGFITRFSMEKRKTYEGKLANAILGGYRVARVKGYIGEMTTYLKPYNLHVEVK